MGCVPCLPGSAREGTNTSQPRHVKVVEEREQKHGGKLDDPTEMCNGENEHLLLIRAQDISLLSFITRVQWLSLGIPCADFSF